MPAPAPFQVSTLAWHEPPGHTDSFSQYLVGLEEDGAGVDVRMSRCRPGGSVAAHLHEEADQIYVFLSGSGQITSNGVEHDVKGDMCIHVPRGIEHSIRGTGSEDLVFIVVTWPSGTLPR